VSPDILPDRTVHSQALAYRADGLSVVPVKLDGSKSPDLQTWTEYQQRRPRSEELDAWFDRRDPPGIAAICGTVSGNLELLDFDAGELFDTWRELVEAECPGLVGRLTVVRTPREQGFHVWYRCPGRTIPGNEKLAEEPYTDAEGKRRKRTLIETRGEGGIGLLPGCPVECHENRRPYVHESGPPIGGAVVTPAEWEVLRRVARSFTKVAPQELHAGNGRHEGGRPGDDYNRRASWEEILGPHGWAVVRQAGGVSYWRRPGKEGPGWSATTGHHAGKDGTDRLHVFSTNADPFEDGRDYDKFAAYALLDHAGDFKAAAKQLAAEGYGDRPAGGSGSRGKHSTPDQAEPEAVEAGPLRLHPGKPQRSSSGKLTVPVTVFRDGRALDHILLTSAASSRKEAVRHLARHAGGGGATAEVEAAGTEVLTAAVAEVLAAAARRVEEAPSADAPDVYAVVFDRAVRSFHFSHRTPEGYLWSEALRREVGRGEFLAWTPLDLCKAVGQAVGAVGDPLALLPAVKRALEVTWASLWVHLPPAESAELDEKSAAATRFREAVKRLWTETTTLESVQSVGPAGSQTTAARTSLIGRVHSQMAKPELGLGRWQEVQKSFAAWWRRHEASDGEIRTLLAVNYALTYQMRVPLPGVYHEESFAAVGKKLGAWQPPPADVPASDSGSRKRLQVVVDDLTAELLEDPTTWKNPGTP
jgi:hypothetical protein